MNLKEFFRPDKSILLIFILLSLLTIVLGFVLLPIDLSFQKLSNVVGYIVFLPYRLGQVIFGLYSGLIFQIIAIYLISAFLKKILFKKS